MYIMQMVIMHGGKLLDLWNQETLCISKDLTVNNPCALASFSPGANLQINASVEKGQCAMVRHMHLSTIRVAVSSQGYKSTRRKLSAAGVMATGAGAVNTGAEEMALYGGMWTGRRRQMMPHNAECMQSKPALAVTCIINSQSLWFNPDFQLACDLAWQLIGHTRPDQICVRCRIAGSTMLISPGSLHMIGGTQHNLVRQQRETLPKFGHGHW
jgi:hypothetical protein